MNKFKRDSSYLLRYCIQTILILVLFSLILVVTKGTDFYYSYQNWMLVLPVISLLLCGLPSSILHNCAHGNCGRKPINNFIGEVLGTFMLYGYKGFKLGHMFHHKYPDNPLYDPHPPTGHSFLSFLVSPIKATLDVIERSYYEEFGRSSSTESNVLFQKILFNISIVVRIVFWFLLFGPEVFLLFYLPAYMLNIFVFAHINFAAHRENRDGSSEIINLNNNAYYKIVNGLSFGGYFHKNHHRKPQAFNPSKVNIINDTAYITYQNKKREHSLMPIPVLGMRSI